MFVTNGFAWQTCKEAEQTRKTTWSHNHEYTVQDTALHNTLDAAKTMSDSSKEHDKLRCRGSKPNRCLQEVCLCPASKPIGTTQRTHGHRVQRITFCLHIDSIYENQFGIA